METAISRRALLVMDAQESFRQREDWQAVSNPGIAGQIGRLVRHARGRGDLVVWVLHSEPGTGTVFDPVNGHVRLLAGLAPQDGEPQLTRTVHNAFTTTNPQRLLTARGIRELIVSGIRTEQCCETTARLASDLGHHVIFAIDATATTPTEHRDAPAGSPLCRGDRQDRVARRPAPRTVDPRRGGGPVVSADPVGPGPGTGKPPARRR